MTYKVKVGDWIKVDGYDAIVTDIDTECGSCSYKVLFQENVSKWVGESDIKPISEHMTPDELAELIASTPTERDDISKLGSDYDYPKDDLDKMFEGMKDENTDFKVGIENLIERKFEVLCGSDILATGMSLDDALLFINAMFSKRSIDVSTVLSIKELKH